MFILIRCPSWMEEEQKGGCIDRDAFLRCRRHRRAIENIFIPPTTAGRDVQAALVHHVSHSHIARSQPSLCNECVADYFLSWNNYSSKHKMSMLWPGILRLKHTPAICMWIATHLSTIANYAFFVQKRSSRSLTADGSRICWDWELTKGKKTLTIQPKQHSTKPANERGKVFPRSRSSCAAIVSAFD